MSNSEKKEEIIQKTETKEVKKVRNVYDTALLTAVIVGTIFFVVIAILVPLRFVPSAVQSIATTIRGAASGNANSENAGSKNTPAAADTTATNPPLTNSGQSPSTGSTDSTRSPQASRPQADSTNSPQASSGQAASDTGSQNQISNTPTVSISQPQPVPTTPSYSTIASPSQTIVPQVAAPVYIPQGIDLVPAIVSHVISGNQATVRFRVHNRGSILSGAWQLSATLPTSDIYARQYLSQSLLPIAAGSGAEYIISFAKDPYQNYFAIRVDPSGLVAESNENNNTASLALILPLQNYPSPYYPPSTYGGQYGNADLSAEINEIRYAGSYSEPQYFFERGRSVTAYFRIRNLSGQTISSFSYRISTPGAAPTILRYNSPLALGEVASLNTTFVITGSGTQTITLEADPSNEIYDSYRANNIATRQFSVY